MDHPFKSPAILSLCTGMRGLERGIERAIGQVRTVAFLEIEAFVIENLVRQMEQGVLAPAPIWSNIKTFPAQQFYGKIHGITGGYPCQPFSLAGERGGVEDPRHLWPHIFNIIRTVRPVWCFFENVTGHITLGYREVRSQLQSVGYKIEQGIYSAEEVGAPHQRKRLFILAIRSDQFSQLNEQLVNTNNNGLSGNGERKTTGKNDQGGRSERIETFGIGRTNTKTGGLSENEAGVRELANPKTIGMERIGSEGKQISDSHERQGLSVRQSGRDRWPARPDESQYEWEAPRIESSVGYTVNGYNFREDLLRMAGNAVVEQTAELAFRSLLRKHGLI